MSRSVEEDAQRYIESDTALRSSFKEISSSIKNRNLSGLASGTLRFLGAGALLGLRWTNFVNSYTRFAYREFPLADHDDNLLSVAQAIVADSVESDGSDGHNLSVVETPEV